MMRLYLAGSIFQPARMAAIDGHRRRARRFRLRHRTNANTQPLESASGTKQTLGGSRANRPGEAMNGAVERDRRITDELTRFLIRDNPDGRAADGRVPRSRRSA
jgi:hypothetical protein